jgi:hypothetical protein
MWAKAREYSNDTPFDDVAEELRRTESLLRKTLGEEAIVHCSNWADILSGKQT